MPKVELGDGAKILLIKWAWGGTDLQNDWRPPSSGGALGWCYGNMTETVHRVLSSELADVVPGFDYGADSFEVSGFAWHQGWNDGCGDEGTNEYEANLRNLVHDVRSEFGVQMPVSIGLSGFGGLALRLLLRRQPGALRMDPLKLSRLLCRLQVESLQGEVDLARVRALRARSLLRTC